MNSLAAADSPAGLGSQLYVVGLGQRPRRWIWSATHGVASSAGGLEGERDLPCGPGLASLAPVDPCRRAIGAVPFGANAEAAARSSRMRLHQARRSFHAAAERLRCDATACGRATPTRQRGAGGLAHTRELLTPRNLAWATSAERGCRGAGRHADAKPFTPAAQQPQRTLYPPADRLPQVASCPPPPRTVRRCSSSACWRSRQRVLRARASSGRRSSTRASSSLASCSTCRA